MMSMRTGFGETADALFEGCCVLYNRTQKIAQTVGGKSSGRNTARDCCMKSATTPNIPNTNPSPLTRGRAPAVSICSVDMGERTNCEVYRSVFLRNPVKRRQLALTNIGSLQHLILPPTTGWRGGFLRTSSFIPRTRALPCSRLLERSGLLSG